MSKQKRKQPENQPLAAASADSVPAARSGKAGLWLALVSVVAVGGIAAAVVFAKRHRSGSPAGPASVGSTTVSAATSSVAAPSLGSLSNEPPVMEINKAVMVTVELDFGSVVPSIAQALFEVERRHKPEDGTGRTFAILDAYGGPTPDGKKLHLSMHVSTEKPGIGELVFKRTGEVLWKSRIVRGTNSSTFSGKNLLILIDNGAGKTFTVDGSGGPRSILGASVKELNMPIGQFWPEGAERELTFIYSACGCPVKVMCKRVGDRTARVKDLPVIFPDDPTVETFISQLMGW